MSRYRKLPVEIEAVRFQGWEARELCPLFADPPVILTPDKWPSWLIEAWALGHPDGWREVPSPGALVECSEQLLAISLEGPMVVSPGDFIIRGVQGEIYPCKPDIFAATYEVAGPHCDKVAVHEDGWSEWIHPLPDFEMQCCDCGLVHVMQFQIAARHGDGPLNPGEDDETGVIIFRARRATAEEGIVA